MYGSACQNAHVGVAGVRVFYRFSSAGNLKSRPPYFSKGLALASFIRALQAAEGRATATFVVDGDVSEAFLKAMSEVGSVVRGSYGSNRSSYRATVTMAATSSSGEPLTWFAEDDYLYEENSLAELLAAAAEIPEATWFALSGPTPPSMLEMRKAQGPVVVPGLDRTGGTATVNGQIWRRIDSTTSTFGGRTQRVVRDARLLRAIPWTGAAWDRTTCLCVQGVTPYPWRHVLSDLVVPSTPEGKRALRVGYRVATRIAVNVRSIRRPANRGILVAPAVALVGHMNLPYEERPEHWESVARQVVEWARQAGYAALVDATRPSG